MIKSLAKSVVFNGKYGMSNSLPWYFSSRSGKPGKCLFSIHVHLSGSLDIAN